MFVAPSLGVLPSGGLFLCRLLAKQHDNILQCLYLCFKAFYLQVLLLMAGCVCLVEEIADGDVVEGRYFFQRADLYVSSFLEELRQVLVGGAHQLGIAVFILALVKEGFEFGGVHRLFNILITVVAWCAPHVDGYLFVYFLLVAATGAQAIAFYRGMVGVRAFAGAYPHLSCLILLFVVELAVLQNLPILVTLRA